MGGISIAHGEKRVPSTIHKSLVSLQLQTHGKKTITSRVDTRPHDGDLQPYPLTADFLGLGHMGNATMVGYTVLCPIQKS